MNPAFWRGRRVFVTGHSGFKGSWLSLWLQNMGADVSGYSSGSPSRPCLFDLAGVASYCRPVARGEPVLAGRSCRSRNAAAALSTVTIFA